MVGRRNTEWFTEREVPEQDIRNFHINKTQEGKARKQKRKA